MFFVSKIVVLDVPEYIVMMVGILYPVSGGWILSVHARVVACDRLDWLLAASLVRYHNNSKIRSFKAGVGWRGRATVFSLANVTTVLLIA